MYSKIKFVLVPNQMWAVIIIATLLMGSPAPTLSEPKPDTQPKQGVWAPLGVDIESAVIRQPGSAIVDSETVLIRTALKHHKLGLIRAPALGVPRLSVKDMCLKRRALVCINANFFDLSGLALGLLVENGRQIQAPHLGGKTLTGIFTVSKRGPEIIHRTDFKSANVDLALQAGPRLVASGNTLTSAQMTDRSRRAGVCIDDQKRVIFFIASAGLLGLTLDELSHLLIRPEIGCRDALNLDGGGSAQLYVDAIANSSAINLPGRDDVPVALAFFPRS